VFLYNQRFSIPIMIVTRNNNLEVESHNCTEPTLKFFFEEGGGPVLISLFYFFFFFTHSFLSALDHVETRELCLHTLYHEYVDSFIWRYYIIVPLSDSVV